jgi:hypothetical protein
MDERVGDTFTPGGNDVELGLCAWLGSIAASLADKLSKPGLWETIFGHNIAWKYFRSDDAGESIFNEGFCGQRWFKFRHLDEIFINQQLARVFGSKAPYLVLGHSHEPRHRSWNPATSKQEKYYLNGDIALLIHLIVPTVRLAWLIQPFLSGACFL